MGVYFEFIILKLNLVVNFFKFFNEREQSFTVFYDALPLTRVQTTDGNTPRSRTTTICVKIEIILSFTSVFFKRTQNRQQHIRTSADFFFIKQITTDRYRKI